MRMTGLLILIAVAGCKKEDAAAAAPPPPPLVTISQPERRDVTEYITMTGHTRAIASVEVRARVLGFLEKMNYEPGKLVEQGQILFEIEKDDYQAQVQRAEAELTAAEADQEKAKSDLERFEEALKSNAVSKVQVTQARAELLRAEAAIIGAQASLKRANLSLSYCEVRAPIAGLVSRNLVDVGNLVGPDQKDAALLTTVVQRQPIYAYFEIPEQFVNYALERQAEREARGGKRNVVVEVALPDRAFEHKGMVDWVDNKVDSPTGTLRARGVFENDRGLLYSGVFVRVRVELGVRKDAILVQDAAIQIDLGGKYLLVVNDKDIVERRYITALQTIGAMRVLAPREEKVVSKDGVPVAEGARKGLEGTERYITDGIVKARVGLPVRADSAGTKQ